MTTRRALGVLGIALGLMLMCTGSASAVPFYFASGNGQTETGPNDALVASVVTNRRADLDGAVIESIRAARAEASRGHLGVIADASVHIPGTQRITGESAIVQATARFRLDDVVFSVPGATGLQTTSLNLHLSGSTTTDVETHIAFGEAAAVIAIDGWLRSSPPFLTEHDFTGQIGCQSPPSSSGACSKSGMLTNFIGEAQDPSGEVIIGDQLLTSRAIQVPVNTPLLFQLELVALAEAEASITGTFANNPSRAEVHGASSFARSLDFPTEGPVFNVDPDVTVNSEQGGIVNNQFIGGATPGAEVPEPSTWFLLSSGVIALGLWRKRRA